MTPQPEETLGFRLATPDEIRALAAEGIFLHYDSIKMCIRDRCDRIYIMNEGKMVGELAGSEATQELIMSHILGTAGKEQTA